MAPSGFSSAAQGFVLTFLLIIELIRTMIGNSIEIEVQDVFSRGRSENRYCLDQKTWIDGRTIEPKKERKSKVAKGAMQTGKSYSNCGQGHRWGEIVSEKMMVSQQKGRDRTKVPVS